MPQQQKTARFEVDLDVYSGPFSVLLDLISKKSLDVTDVALAEVTDDYLEFLRSHNEADLSEMSEFLVVAATLLALKAARLLPNYTDDEEDWELIEQRDLLFAKLLQYRAFKQVAADFSLRLDKQAQATPRDVPLEEEFANLLPPVRINLTPHELALLVARAYEHAEDQPQLSTAHVHSPVVDVYQQIRVVKNLLSRGPSTFEELCADNPSHSVIVARFLAVLHLLRHKAITIEQPVPLGSLTITPTPAEEINVITTEE